MAKGHNRIQILGSAGYVSGQKHGLWDFIYETSTTKSSLYNVGDVVIIPNRGIFIYSKSSAACISGQGCEFVYTGYITYTAFATAHAVGVREVTVPAAAHAALALDELRNGHCWIFDGSTNNVQFRQILGNAAADASAAFAIQLDGPLKEAVVSGTSAIEVCQNPYASLRTGTSDSLAKAGVPAAKVTAANIYFWCQGSLPNFCWVAPQGGVNDRDVGCWWRHDGSLQDTELAIMAGTSLSAGISSQYAGHRVMGNEDNIGPLFQLA
jgi:hypothetical protein